jgi:hypothetical protein
MKARVYMLLLIVIATLAVQFTPIHTTSNSISAVLRDGTSPLPPWRDGTSPLPPWQSRS